MTSKIIDTHPERGLALLLDQETRKYWVGEYDSMLKDQYSEPPYHWVGGDWDSKVQAEISFALWI